MIAALILLPALAGVLALTVWADSLRRILLVATASAHACLVTRAWAVPPPPVLNGWLALDSAGMCFLAIISILFLASSIYGAGYLKRGGHSPDTGSDCESGFLLVNAPEAVFTACLLFFLATMTFVTVSQHLGLLWVAIEATTLSSAPLIYFHRHPRSLEATWKYLLICSVGIALALLGNFFLAVSGSGALRGMPEDLTVAGLVAAGPDLSVPWLKAALIFFLVGYGTKMGLAPMHTWLPDAHSESPSVVSALLSGALLNCAFLGILRIFQICHAAGIAAFAQDLFIGFGILSMGVAAAFIVGQADYKRMLAYSSVEHMGILMLGVGIGGAGVFGAMLHAVNHSLAKALLFFAAGNILMAYRSKNVAEVRGVGRRLPVTGILWIVGFLAITGSPPFGAFVSEFTILKAAMDQQLWMVAAAYLVALSVIFVGMAGIVLGMAQGTAPEPRKPMARVEAWTSVAPPAALAIATLLLGLYLPPALRTVLENAARLMGGQ